MSKFDSNKAIKFAFEIIGDKLILKETGKGLKFYKFDDTNDMPYGRASYTLDYFEESRQRVTRERLEAHLTAMENAINSTHVQMTTIVKLVVQLRERLEMIFEPESLYKIASVIFFTEDENPNDYSFKKGQEKIKLFQKVGADFFLSIPIKNTLPIPDLSDSDFRAYLKIAQGINSQELKGISTMLSKEDKTKEYFKSLMLQSD